MRLENWSLTVVSIDNAVRFQSFQSQLNLSFAFRRSDGVIISVSTFCEEFIISQKQFALSTKLRIWTHAMDATYVNISRGCYSLGLDT